MSLRLLPQRCKAHEKAIMLIYKHDQLVSAEAARLAGRLEAERQLPFLCSMAYAACMHAGICLESFLYERPRQE